METFIWGIQFFIAAVFLYSGIMKATQPEQKLVTIGQTGVEGLPASFIKFIGVSEIMGAIGLILPWWLKIVPVLTPISAICLGSIMFPASIIHYKRQENKSVLVNIILLLLCGWIASI